jgi:ABC-type transport system involved in Fe-S cluster assembly fused permease/ATPase subunit
MTDTAASSSALRQALRLLWSESDAYIKRRLTAALALVIGYSMLTALAPIAFAYLVDDFAERQQQRDYWLPAMLLGAYVLSQFLVRALSSIRDLLHGRGEQRLYRHLSRRLFSHIIRLPLRFHLERKTGAMGETLTQGLHGYQMLIQHLVYTILPSIVEFATIVVVLIAFGHPLYLVIYALAAVSYAYAFARGATAVTEPARTASAAHVEAHAVLTDSLLNYETVKYFDAEGVVYEKYDRALARTESAWGLFYLRRTSNSLVVGVIFAVSLMAALGMAGYEVVRGTMTIGEFVLINTYMLRITVPLEMLGYAVRDVSQGLAFLQKMLELFREQPELDAVASETLTDSARGELVFDHVNFSYRSDRPVLRDVSFSVPAGRTVAIVGMSGSGKSSLIRLLFRLCEPDGGQIRLDGVPIASMPLSQLRRAIAVVPQDMVLFNDTIGNNIAFGRAGSSREHVERAVGLAHLHGFVAGLPEGLDTMVGERGLKLSGGERQRVAIARAAVKQPRIFVFDEATSSLDTRTEREILRNLMEVSQGCTTLVIAHRLSTIVHADEIVVLEGGVVVERGTHANLLQSNGAYAALWRVQHHVGPVDDTRLATRA